MAETTELGLGQRLWLCIAVFFRFLADGQFAGRVAANWSAAPSLPAPKDITVPAVREEPKPVVKPPEPKPEPKPLAPAAPDHASALHLLAILQREGRLVDFLQEDVSSYGDADVGAAARVVHTGCRKVLADYFTLEPLRTEGEGAPVRIEKGFDPSAVRLTGNVTGEPPFSGALRHHGWKAAEVRLPPIPSGQDVKVVAPAEVEL